MRKRAMASLLIVAIVVGAGVGYLIGYANEHTVKCTNLTSRGIPTPAPTAPWFAGEVSYSGPWMAIATFYTNGAPIATSCYTGDDTDGIFIYQSPSLTNTSTIRLEATKLDRSTAILYAVCNGNINSTSAPYGSVVLTAPVNHENH